LDAKVIWKKGLSFTGSADSEFTIPLGTEVSQGGEEDGFRPMELFAIGLAGCTAMDIISILNKKGQMVSAFEVRAHVERAQDFPKVFTSGVVEYLVTGHNIDEAALIRSMELSATRYCPAQAMLGKIMPIELKYQIFEGGENGQRTLVKCGVYHASVAAGAAS
jgi:putative redox protein